jgi:ketosteroid isomerase-like protein
MVNDTSAGHIADRFFGAIERGEIAALAQLCTEDAVVWHNFDEREQTAAENRSILERFATVMKQWRYCVRTRNVFPDGFVQQHVLTGIVGGSVPISIPICVVGRVRDGRIARIDEYFDPARLAPVRECLQAGSPRPEEKSSDRL